MPPLDVTVGRPDISVFLSDLARSCADHQEIGIVAAGAAAACPDMPYKSWQCLSELETPPAQVPRRW